MEEKNTMTITLYHNPRCSKSRQALALLEEKGETPDIKLYLETPPTVDELITVLKLLNMAPRDLMRKKEAAEYGLNEPSLSDQQIIEGLCANPRAIERPIAIKDDQAVVGRPPENVLDLL